MNPEELPSSVVRRLSPSSVVPVFVMVTPGVLVSGEGEGEGEGDGALSSSMFLMVTVDVSVPA